MNTRITHFVTTRNRIYPRTIDFGRKRGRKASNQNLYALESRETEDIDSQYSFSNASSPYPVIKFANSIFALKSQLTIIFSQEMENFNDDSSSHVDIEDETKILEPNPTAQVKQEPES